MWIIGCDFHPRYQQIAALNQATKEFMERRLSHEGKEATIFYESLPSRCADRNGSDLHSAVVRALAGTLRAHFAGGRCGPDSCFGGTQAKDRYSRCPACAGSAGERSLPARLDTHARRARCPAVAVASP